MLRRRKRSEAAPSDNDPSRASDDVRQGDPPDPGLVGFINSVAAPAWLAIIVDRASEPTYLVKRIAEDVKWYRLPPGRAPEFATATAGSLTRALDGSPMPPLLFGHGPVADNPANP